MLVTSILQEVRSARGPKEKIKILIEHKDNKLLKKILLYGLDPFTPYNIVKVPKVKTRFTAQNEDLRWNAFFDVADLCAKRSYTGNYAIEMMQDAFCVATEDEEVWMRKILKKHLSIGASTKTINKVFPDLIPTFDVALAQKFEEKRIPGKRIAVEPKLDGIRCFAIVEDGQALLYARSGKVITNFDDTIGVDLAELGDGCYDGEIMGKDFIALMRQAYRKENVETEGTYLALFDYLPLKEWKTRQSRMSCEDRYFTLVRRVLGADVNNNEEDLPNIRDPNYLRVVRRLYAGSNYVEIKELHDQFVSEGYEGAMIKDLDAPYKFGRGPEVMKLKAFHDADCVVLRVEEGTGKFVQTCGNLVVDFNGTEVGVGSGLTDEDRKMIWNAPQDFIGRLAEIRYQEITPDGSLRFPTFVCWRNDRD